MTNTAHAPPLEYTDLAGAIAALRRRGLRLSTTRRLILEALFAADGPVSAEHIMRRLSLDLTTVYRNLETLENHGVVRHVHLGHGPGLYALLAPGEREYLYCEHCGAVRALPRQELDAFRSGVREQFGYEVSFSHFAIVGSCPTCSTQREQEPTPGPSDRREPTTSHERHEHDQHGHGHEHAHSHGDRVHSHPHSHAADHERRHQHGDQP